MSQIDGRRRIRVQNLKLDPMSKWFFSRREIGNVNGERLEGRDNQYRSIYIPGTRSTEETYTVVPGQDTLQFIYSSLRAGQTQDIQNSLYRVNNQYVYKDPVPGPDQTTIYSSFSQEILNNYLITCDKVLNGILEPAGRGSIHQELRFRFYPFAIRQNGTLLRLSRDYIRSGAEALLQTLMDDPASSVIIQNNIEDMSTLGDFFTAAFDGQTVTGKNILDTQQQNGDPIQLSLLDVVRSIYDDITLETYNEGASLDFIGATAGEIITLVHAVLFRAMLDQSLFTLDRAFAFMQDEDYYDYEYVNIETSTPYVKNQGNARFLSGLLFEGPQDSPAVVRPAYGFYQESYENNTHVDGIGENLLPNLYARRFFQAAEAINAKNNLEDDQKKGLLTEYTDLLTLTTDPERIINVKGENYYQQLVNSLEGGLPEDFYSLYAELLDPSEPTYQFATQGLLTKNKQFIIGCYEMSQAGLSAGASAMNLNISFVRDNISRTDVSDFIIDQERDSSLAIFQNIKNSGQDDISEIPFLYSTEYLANNEQRETPKVPVRFKTHELFGMNSYILSNIPEAYSSTILQRHGKRPTRAHLQQVQTYIQNNKRRRCPTDVTPMLTGQNTNSEVLGYRLRKITSDTPGNFSEIFIGNSGRERVVYTDTQVKYGTNYTYDLSEFRIVYGAIYNTWVLSSNVPSAILMGYLGVYNETETTEQMNLLRNFVQIAFTSRSEIQPTAQLVEIPVYDNYFLSQEIFPTVFGGGPFDMLTLKARSDLGAGGIAYPKTKVLDFPPTPPIIEFFPRAFIDNQVDINVTPVSGKVGTINSNNGTFDESLEIVSIGDNDQNISDQKTFQETHQLGLEENSLKYDFKSVSEIRNITIYRTTNMNLNVENQKELYSSFNPGTNDDVVVRKYTAKRFSPDGLEDMIKVLSYDIRESIQPNINYFYTCVVHDVHNNVSNPSTIFRVRLLSENGMVIPEVSTVIPEGTNRKMSDKNLARYIQIDASNIQTFPFVANTENGIINSRSLGVALNKKIENKSYIVRLTSKDTGRKFDLKLKFVVRINGNPINGIT